MERLNSVDEILDFAIQNEIKAYQLYTDLAKKAEKAWIREIFEEFAEEENKHREKLESVKEGGKLVPSEKDVLDIKIADYLVEVQPSPEMSFQDALILVMKAEKAAFALYTHLAQKADNADLRDTFIALSQEEAKHKLRFEIMYDDAFYTEQSYS